MGGARTASKSAAVPATPRRAHTAPLSQQNRSPPLSSSSSGEPAAAAAPVAAITIAGTGGPSAAAKAAAATAAAEAAAAAADFGTSPKSDLSSTDPATQPQTGANGEAVETLYSHPNAKIISFTAGARNFSLDNIGSTASRSRASASRRSITTTEEDIEPGTLPWSSQFDRTIAVGALSIYRHPGSVAFLSCGSALQPILPKSQCWCIDRESSKFILQIRRPQYWRIEVPVGDDGENDERARRLREVLDHILQFEKTPCPFKRDFTVDLPEQPSTPLKKKPWTPVKQPETKAPGTPGTPSNQTKQLTPLRQQRSPSPPELQESPASMSPIQQDASPVAPAQPMEFTRREWLAMLESQKKGGSAEEVDEFGRRIVPALVATHEQRIIDAKAGEIEVSKNGVPWRNNSVSGASMPPGSRHGSVGQRDRALSLASDNSAAALRSAWPSLDKRWLEDSDRSTADSSSPFNSLRSWLSSGKGLTSSPPSSTSGSSYGPDGLAIPPGLASLYEDARRMFNNGTGVSTGAEQQRPPIRHRATTSSISVSNHAPASLPPAANLLAPHRHFQSLNSGRASTRLEAVRRIPGSIIYRVMEILLAPPSYLLALMLKIAARILSGEWRGFAVGKNTDTGESISAQWDYTDVDDPLDRRTTKTRAMASSRRDEVSRLNVYTEADVEHYTDAEEVEDDDDDNNDSSLSGLKRSNSTSSRATSDSGDSDTLSDVGGDPIVWTRRWAVD